VKHSLFVACIGIAALIGGIMPSWAVDPAAEVLERSREHCRSINEGEFHADDGAVTQLDLTGDDVPEQVVDASHFSCSTAVTPYCGTGGCPLTVIVDRKPVEFLALRWKVINWDDQPVLLLHVDSAACDSNDWQPCIIALAWSDGSFRGVVSRP
jgi:hypothetical protein